MPTRTINLYKINRDSNSSTTLVLRSFSNKDKRKELQPNSKVIQTLWEEVDRLMLETWNHSWEARRTFITYLQTKVRLVGNYCFASYTQFYKPWLTCIIYRSDILATL